MSRRPKELVFQEDSNPTKELYGEFVRAYDFFNRRLFNSKLPSGLLILHSKSGSLGYFSPERYNVRDGHQPTDCIALNPKHFKGRSTEEILSTFVHEMAHQFEFRCVSHKKKSYHDKSWGSIMKSVGLYPSDTASPGGRETGWRVSHYVVVGGPFFMACAEFVASGCRIAYVEPGHDAEPKKQDNSKTKFTCPACAMNVWGKATVEVTCTACQMPMEMEGKTNSIDK